VEQVKFQIPEFELSLRELLTLVAPTHTQINLQIISSRIRKRIALRNEIEFDYAQRRSVGASGSVCVMDLQVCA